jgi:hypothetical protein
MGAVFMVAGLLAGSVYYGWQFHLMKLPLLSFFLRVFVTTFLAAGTGKIIGLSRHWLEQKDVIPMRFMRPLVTRKGE